MKIRVKDLSGRVVILDLPELDARKLIQSGSAEPAESPGRAPLENTMAEPERERRKNE